MFETWGMDMYGGTHYKGHCHICGKSNGDVYDSPHEECVMNEPKRCPDCWCLTVAEDFTNGVCNYCYQMSLETT